MPWPHRSVAPRTLEHDPGCSWSEWAHGQVNDDALRQQLTETCAAHAGIFWECLPTARHLADRPFRFATVESSSVASLVADRGPFRRHLEAAKGPVATFDNLGRDAVLVAPVGAVPGGCAHLASWCRSAPADEQHALWAAVGQGVLDWWERTDTPVWVSTSGLGVSWLHVRLDTRPKYVTHRPYRTPPH